MTNRSEFHDSVIVSFGSFNGLDEIHEVDELLTKIIPGEVGYHDFHEVCMDDTDGRFFSYGRNAEELFKLMRPVLKKFQFSNESYIYLSFMENGNLKSDLEFKLNKG